MRLIRVFVFIIALLGIVNIVGYIIRSRTTCKDCGYFHEIHKVRHRARVQIRATTCASSFPSPSRSCAPDVLVIWRISYVSPY